MKIPQVHLLMATYNGSRYLNEQLNSLTNQSHRNWILSISDDGSVDNTLSLLQTYQNSIENNVVIYAGPQRGFAANFLFLVNKININSDFYAFVDQDDIWEAHKLEQAVTWLQTIHPQQPGLYCARTKLIDADKKILGHSPLFKKKPSFLNALVQNIAGGNTMVFNRAALQLLRATKDYNTIVAHDWWTYLLVSGAGGVVYYNTCPSVQYRQHNNNAIGSNTAWYARFIRTQMLFQGRLKRWIESNIDHLAATQNILNEENKIILRQFMQARRYGVLLRILRLKQLGIYRQTTLGSIGLIVAALFNKL